MKSSVLTPIQFPGLVGFLLTAFSINIGFSSIFSPLINGKRDRDTHTRMKRCFYCQIDFEADLKTHGKWHDWVKEQEIARWKSILEDIEIDEEEQKDKKIFDKSVANALANHNLDLTIKKTK